MKRNWLVVVGFLMFSLGILSLILSMVGLQLSPLKFMYGMGGLTIIIQLILLFGGMIILYVSRTGIEE